MSAYTSFVLDANGSIPARYNPNLSKPSKISSALNGATAITTTSTTTSSLTDNGNLLVVGATTLSGSLAVNGTATFAVLPTCTATPNSATQLVPKQFIDASLSVINSTISQLSYYSGSNYTTVNSNFTVGPINNTLNTYFYGTTSFLWNTKFDVSLPTTTLAASAVSGTNQFVHKLYCDSFYSPIANPSFTGVLREQTIGEAVSAVSVVNLGSNTALVYYSSSAVFDISNALATTPFIINIINLSTVVVANTSYSITCMIDLTGTYRTYGGTIQVAGTGYTPVWIGGTPTINSTTNTLIQTITVVYTSSTTVPRKVICSVSQAV